MKATNKLIIVGIIILAATLAALFQLKRTRTNKPAFTIEWLEITPQTKESMAPLLEQLQTIFKEAMFPVGKSLLYATDPRITNLSPEQKAAAESKISAGMLEGLKAHWQQKISALYSDLETKQISAAYLAIAKDCHHTPIGFALYTQVPIKEFLTSTLEKVIEGSLENIETIAKQDTAIFLSQLAVIPGTQKKGIGVALVFSAFDHEPHITNIFLRTFAHPQNINAQSFYEHIGFKRLFTGQFKKEQEGPAFGEEIVYMYTKKEAFILETSRTILRQATLADAPALSHILSDREVIRYFPFGPLDEQATRTYLKRMIEKYKKDGFAKWAVIDKQTNKLIGMCGIHKMEIDGEKQVEIGYYLAKVYWGNGLGTEIAQAVRDYAFNVLNLSDLTAVIDKENIASQHVAEKIGMKYWKDSSLWGKTWVVYRLKRSDLQK